jgi:adenylyltransferase/sulfurtransferase
MHDRYHRQRILPQVGDAGQERLSAARVVLIGCGALGTVLAESLARAGVGHLLLADRDLVEWTNLQRQTLYAESDAAEARPKAVAAAQRLAAVNSQVRLEARPIDVDSGNIESLIEGATLVLDGTDNAAVRYLLNDACVKLHVPWIYGAAIAMEGRVMPILPGRGPCLRCIFREMPPAGELDTCDTAGVLGATAGLVANLQSALAIRMLVTGDAPLQLHAIDAWDGQVQAVDVSEARDPDCPCCGRQSFEFLARPPADSAALCGQDAVQIRPPARTTLDLAVLARRLEKAGKVQALPMMLRFVPSDRPGLKLSAFADGRLIVQGTREISEARSLYARYVGA